MYEFKGLSAELLDLIILCVKMMFEDSGIHANEEII